MNGILQQTRSTQNEAIFKHTYDCTYIATIIDSALGAALAAAAGLGAACAEGPAPPPRELRCNQFNFLDCTWARALSISGPALVRSRPTLSLELTVPRAGLSGQAGRQTGRRGSEGGARAACCAGLGAPIFS